MSKNQSLGLSSWIVRGGGDKPNYIHIERYCFLSAPHVVEYPASNIHLECAAQEMIITVNQSTFLSLGIELEDLQPLQENCSGFTRLAEREHLIYNIPLTGCGAEVKVGRSDTL